MAANTKTFYDVLFAIQKQYFQMVPFKTFDWKNIEKHLDITLQKAILQKTSMSDRFGSYPPSVKYQRMFLKHLMKLSKEANFELADELYESYAEVIAKAEDDQTPCYKTYILPSGSGIVLEESQSIISQGTTGLSTWQAALYMLEWSLDNRELFQNREKFLFKHCPLIIKHVLIDHFTDAIAQPQLHQRVMNVLELGCGLGLLGLSICESCSPHHYIFTDCHETVLEKLDKNLSINGYHKSIDSKCHCEKIETEVSKCPCIDSECSNLIRSRWCLGSKGMNDRSTSVDFEDDKQLLDCKEQEGTVSRSDNFKDCCNDDKPENASELLHKDGNSQETVKKKSTCIGEMPPGMKPCDKIQDKEEVSVTLRESVCRSTGLVNATSVKLDWETVSMDDLERLSCGIILATDVIYDVGLIKFFVPVVLKLLSCHGDGSVKPVAFVASTVRNLDTYQCFIQKLDDFHIKWKVIDKPSRKLFFYDDKSDIRLLKLEI